ncbi:CD276 antigen-like [Centroberyx affinis]|uniref:CD276 antigen-like n=1 Tax=Centroberyx affinis TaxID=166261 RepID=UPI003A5BDDE1
MKGFIFQRGFLSAFVVVFHLVLPLLASSENTNINRTRGAAALWLCHHNLSEPFQPAESRIYWQGQGDSNIVVHVYNKGQEEFQTQSETFRNRTKIFPDQLPLGNLSLVIEPVKLGDDRTSSEVVFMSSRTEKVCQWTLYVAAPFQVPKIEIDPTKMTATCSTQGGYPKPEITWKSRDTSQASERTLEPHEVQTSVTLEEDGTYNISSRVNFTESVKSVSCHVYNPTSNQTVSATRDTTDPPPPVSSHTEAIVVAVVAIVIAAIIVSLAVWTYVCCRRRNENGSNTPHWRMASRGLLFYLLCAPVMAQKPVSATVGGSVLIPCSLNLSVHPTRLRFYWQEDDSEKVLFFWDKNGTEGPRAEQYRNRCRAFNTEFSSGNVSIRLDNVNMEDDQKTIWVSAALLDKNNRPVKDFRKECKSTLQVVAPYQGPVLTINKATNTVTCTAHGGYPEPQVSWTGLNKSSAAPLNLQEAQTSSEQNPRDKTYTVTSTVSVKDLKSVTCKVRNPRSNESIEETTKIGVEQLGLSSGAVAGIVIAVVVLIAVGAVAAFHKKHPEVFGQRNNQVCCCQYKVAQQEERNDEEADAAERIELEEQG